MATSRWSEGGRHNVPQTSYPRTWLCVVCAVIAACADNTGMPSAPRPPSVSHVAATTNPNNVLSTIVTLVADGVDSARVRYESDGDSAASTPFSPTVATNGRLVVVGLRPSTRYTMVVEAVGIGGTTMSVPISVTTGPLPVELRSMHLAGTGRASAGYTLVVPILPDTTADGFVVAFDAAGEIRWYHRFPGLWPIEAKQQWNGNITVYAGRSFGWQPVYGGFVELTPAGDVVRTFSAAGGFYTDPHELVLSYHDTTLVAAHLLEYEIRPLDLRSIGGASNASIAIHGIERQTPNGAAVFRWSSGETFSPADWPIPNPRAMDLVHPSSLTLDLDGNYIVSLQGVDEITKIDATSGALVWRLGGRHNQFQFRDDPLGGFSGQHDVQVLDDGHLLLMDNHSRGGVGAARAVEYSLDATTMVARLVWEYRPAPGIASPILGSVQRLPGGGTLIGFGAAGQVVELTSGGQVMWNAMLSVDGIVVPIAFYRAVRLRSLYRYEHG